MKCKYVWPRVMLRVYIAYLILDKSKINAEIE